MTYDFETSINRRGTDSQKWQKYAERDILPMWVADMDFRSPPAVLEALRQRIDHGIFGYARPTPSTIEAIVSAMESRYGWRIDPEWLVWLPGLVVGLNLAALAFADAGDEVLTLTPIYPPFLTAPRNGGRSTVRVPLALAEGRWEIDWEAMERAITPRSRLFFLCHPHNPVGRVWQPEELARLADFCLRHELVLCSDEIHCDLILDGARHRPTALLSDEIARRTVTLMAPSKTYNIPGLGTSFAIIPDSGLRTQFLKAASGIMAEVTALGYAACEAAYRHGEEWRQQLLARLRANRGLLLDFLGDHLPDIRIEAPIEATYLAWMNVRALKLPDPVAHFETHGVGLSDGAHFGSPRGHYVRLNFGCPPTTLTTGLQRLKNAVAAV